MVHCLRGRLLTAQNSLARFGSAFSQQENTTPPFRTVKTSGVCSVTTTRSTRNIQNEILNEHTVCVLWRDMEPKLWITQDYSVL